MVNVSPRDFGRLEGKVDALLAQLSDHSDEDRQWHAQIDARLRRLEENHAHTAGRRSLVSAGVSAVVAVVVAWLSKHFA